MTRRVLTVSELTSRAKRNVPYIRMQGCWLQELGFHAGDRIIVDGGYGRLAITRIEGARPTPDKKE